MIKKITSLCLPVAIFILFVGMSEFTFAAGPVENAVPSWDRKIPGDKRFLGVLLVKVKFSNGLMADIPTAAYDSETGLVWELVLDTDEVFWWKAKANCYNKIRGRKKRMEASHD